MAKRVPAVAIPSRRTEATWADESALATEGSHCAEGPHAQQDPTDRVCLTPRDERAHHRCRGKPYTYHSYSHEFLCRVCDRENDQRNDEKAKCVRKQAGQAFCHGQTLAVLAEPSWRMSDLILSTEISRLWGGTVCVGRRVWSPFGHHATRESVTLLDSQ